MYRKIWLTIACLCFVVGCGRSGLVPVSGKVTMGGAPLAIGQVVFLNATGNSVSYGSLQSDGSYVVTTGNQPGLKPGEYQVSVVSSTLVAPTQGISEPLPKLLTPVRYSNPATSGLKYTVPSAGGTFDIALDLR